MKIERAVMLLRKCLLFDGQEKLDGCLGEGGIPLDEFYLTFETFHHHTQVQVSVWMKQARLRLVIHAFQIQCGNKHGRLRNFPSRLKPLDLCEDFFADNSRVSLN